MAARVLVNDHDDRCIALASNSNVLFFHPQPSIWEDNISIQSFSTTGSTVAPTSAPRCAVELADVDTANLNGFTPLSSRRCHGCLGLIGLGRDIFICIITNSQEVATVKPGEHVSRITGVEFCKPDLEDLVLLNVANLPRLSESSGLRLHASIRSELISRGNRWL